MVGFRNAVRGRRASPTGGTTAATRSPSAAAARATSPSTTDGALTRTFQTSLPAGTYCDVAQASPDDCAGNTVTSATTARSRATVPAKGAVALHIGAKS